MKRIPVIFIIAIMLWSCGPYSFSGATITGVETVYIPVFGNETVEYGLGDELTNKVTEAIVADNSLKVVGKEDADAVISGDIVSYKRTSETYNIEDQVQEYRVSVSVNVRFATPGGELIWEEKNMSAYGLYSADSETEDDGKAEALEKLAEVIVNRTVRDW